MLTSKGPAHNKDPFFDDSVNLLLVDGEAEAEELYSYISKRYRVTWIQQSEHVFEQLFQSHYDIVITNIVFPQGPDGMRLVQELKEKYPFLEILVIAYDDIVEYAREAIGKGASGIILRPLNPEALYWQLRSVIEQRKFHLDNRDPFLINSQQAMHRLRLNEQLFYFAQRLLRTLEHQEVVEIFLAEMCKPTIVKNALLMVTDEFCQSAYIYRLPKENKELGQKVLLEVLSREWFKIRHTKQVSWQNLQVKSFKESGAQEAAAEITQSFPFVANGRIFSLLCLLSETEFSKQQQELIAMQSELGTNVLFNSLRHQNLKVVATIDHVTGVMNRRAFHRELEREISRSGRRNYNLSIIMADIDDFKKINDQYGHQTGDVVLRQVATLLKSLIRKTDILARYGGEEFILVLPDASRQGVEVICRRILNSFQAHEFYSFEKKKIHVSLSLGVFFSQGRMAKEKMISCADKALYQAKRSGKNRFVFFEEK